jgi:putative spermidine/putrescine transport system permease protein
MMALAATSRLWNFAALGLTLALALFLSVPVLLSILTGLMVNQFQGFSAGFSLRWVREVLEQYHGAILLSVWIATLTVLINLVLGTLLAHGLRRVRTRWARALEEMFVMPVAMPGISLGLAMIVSYGALGGFRTHWSFILVGHVLFTLPFMMRAVLAMMQAQQLDVLEEAAASLGAGPWRRLVDVVIPNCRAAMVAGSLMVLTLSIGEFNMTLLLHSPFTPTLPVGLADAYASLRIEVGSAYTLIFFVLIVPLLVAVQLLGTAARGKAP